MKEASKVAASGSNTPEEGSCNTEQEGRTTSQSDTNECVTSTTSRSRTTTRGYPVDPTASNNRHRGRRRDDDDGTRSIASNRSQGASKDGRWSRRGYPDVRSGDASTRRNESCRDRDRSRPTDESRRNGWNRGDGSEQDHERDVARRYVHRSDNWRCHECDLSNPEDVSRCPRCRASKTFPRRRSDPLRQNSYRDTHSAAYEDSHRNTQSAYEMESNRFGSRSQSPSPPIEQFEREWPPCFDEDTDGSAFVLDSFSGMFYEERSDFFYDPKNKLYYGNKKGSYFRYDSSESPPFVKLQNSLQPNESAKGTSDNPLPILSSSEPLETIKKANAVSINLKAKNIKKREKVVTKAQKEQAANIEKWSQRKAEVHVQASPTIVAPPVDGDTGQIGDPDRVTKTIKGEPICTICRRRFRTLEKLKLHETLSELHKQNLSKEKDATAKRAPLPETAAQPFSAEYQDRAQKRRKMYGPELVAPRSRVASRNLASTDDPPQSSKDNLGNNNIGNKMLQKLGWKAGSSLGRQANGCTSLDDGSNEAAGSKNYSQIDAMRQDWDRIEALASGTAHKSNP